MELELILRLHMGETSMSKWSRSAARRFAKQKTEKHTEDAKVLHDREMQERVSGALFIEGRGWREALRPQVITPPPMAPVRGILIGCGLLKPGTGCWYDD